MKAFAFAVVTVAALYAPRHAAAMPSFAGRVPNGMRVECMDEWGEARFPNTKRDRWT